MRKIWLVTTEHLEEALWFRDDEDYKVAMNFVAIQAARCPDVSVLAFILMSNHVHFVLAGSAADAETFILQFKHRYSMYVRHRWKAKEFLRANGVQIKEIPNSDEAPERAIAYVQMNCVGANICANPTLYPWGTGNCFFSMLKTGGTRLANISGRARERLLHSNYEDLPPYWHICPEGYIHPAEYVDVAAVEACFRSPQRMNYFLNSSSKAKKRIENAVAFRDQNILAAIRDLCRSLFGKESFQALTPQEQTEYMRQIRFRFSADVNQIARVCGVSYAAAARILDGI